MKTIEELLRNLARPEVLEFGLVTNRLPSVNIGGKFEPVDDEAPTTERLMQMLVTMGGGRHVDALGDKPVQWTTRLDGVGVIAVAAIMRKDVVQARFTVAKREGGGTIRVATKPAADKTPSVAGQPAAARAGAPAGRVAPMTTVKATQQLTPATSPGASSPPGSARVPAAPAASPSARIPAAPPASARVPAAAPAPVAAPPSAPPTEVPPATSSQEDEWDDDDDGPTLQTASPPVSGSPGAVKSRLDAFAENAALEKAASEAQQRAAEKVTAEKAAAEKAAAEKAAAEKLAAERAAAEKLAAEKAAAQKLAAEKAAAEKAAAQKLAAEKAAAEKAAAEKLAAEKAAAEKAAAEKAAAEKLAAEKAAAEKLAAEKAAAQRAADEKAAQERVAATELAEAAARAVLDKGAGDGRAATDKRAAPPRAPAPRRISTPTSVDAVELAAFDAATRPRAEPPPAAESEPKLRPRATALGVTPPGPAVADKDRPKVDPGATLDSLLAMAVAAQASDLHIVGGRPVLLRVATDLAPRTQPVPTEHVERIAKEIVPARLREAFERDGACDFAVEHPTYGRFRVHVSRHRTGYKVGMRLVPRELPTGAALGLPERVTSSVTASRGLVLVTAPAANGKSTTIAALVEQINRETPRHVITIEEPIEHLHPRKRGLVSQREVGLHVRTSKARAFQAAMREDADVIVVPDARDVEIVRLALLAYEAGKLVILGMNMPSVRTAVDRILDLFDPREEPWVRATLAGALRVVTCQRLVPSADRTRLHAAYEVLPWSVKLHNLVRDGRTHELATVMQLGPAVGVQRLDESLAALVRQQKVTLESASRLAESPKELEALVSRARR